MKDRDLRHERVKKVNVNSFQRLQLLKKLMGQEQKSLTSSFA